MRELDVIGLNPEGTHVVCAEKATGDTFRVLADDKLRAAARGDVPRIGQIEVEADTAMRPRDIQTKIRAGASVEQIAEASGMPVHKVERYAFPVLMERSRAAELAQLGHPVRANGPAEETLAEVVAMAFRARGHDLSAATWDAWKSEDSHWIAQLRWQAGRTENAAHWRFMKDAHGGTVTALDDAATDIVDPDFGRPLRGLASMAPAVVAPTAVAHQESLDDEFEPPISATAHSESAAEEIEIVPVAVNGGPAILTSSPKLTPGGKPASATSASRAAALNAPLSASAKDRRRKPALPSWDDVLLGVRSTH